MIFSSLPGWWTCEALLSMSDSVLGRVIPFLCSWTLRNSLSLLCCLGLFDVISESVICAAGTSGYSMVCWARGKRSDTSTRIGL